MNEHYSSLRMGAAMDGGGEEGGGAGIRSGQEKSEQPSEWENWEAGMWTSEDRVGQRGIPLSNIV